MTWNVHQHWDPLKVCVVGRSYPPEFYNWITVTHVRELFEKIATETEEDYQKIVAKLESFGIEVLRPNIQQVMTSDGAWMPPPMTPRDFMIMIGSVFYENYSFDVVQAYQMVADASWPRVNTQSDYDNLPNRIRSECETQHGFNKHRAPRLAYSEIFNRIQSQGNTIMSHWRQPSVNGAVVSRIGRDLYMGTMMGQDPASLKTAMDLAFPEYRAHVIATEGHSDGTYCPVCPGLIISLRDVPTYAHTFPG